MNKLTVFFLSLIITANLLGQVKIPLWPNDIPNYQKSEDKEVVEISGITRIKLVQTPTIEAYIPPKNNQSGHAILICPGGGYGMLAYDWEGTEIAKWCNTRGITAFVLKYRLPGSKSVTVPYETPLIDAQRAMRLIRSRANDWNIDPDKLGVIGFSAGGHLASTLGTHYDYESSFKKDSIDRLSARPNFMVLMYPVVTMKDDYTHKGSKRNLLGNTPNHELEQQFSNELHVNENTPPTFIVHSSNDKAVPVQNSLQFYNALLKHNVYAEMHIFPVGGHGYALALKFDPIKRWPNMMYSWIKSLD
ncbi:alpha/beta hydrolase [Bacteroidales bacterium]|nr:alpha/beta hydrolase [Bacteroidales bacterium]